VPDLITTTTERSSAVGAVHVHEFISLDGVVDTPSWTFTYGFDPRMGEAIGAVTARCSGILLGRTTYAMFEQGWSERTVEDDPGAPFFNDTTKYVVSSTLTEPTWRNTEVIGGYDAETGDADLAFTGSVRFTGHGGVLDTTIANPRVAIDGTRAVLLLDVTGTTQTGEPVAQQGVEFAELDLAAAERASDGTLVTLTGIPAALTPAGAAAFGTYPAGEALDPVDLSITLDSACAEPVAAVDEPQAMLAEDVAAASPLPWVIGAVGLLLLVAALAVVVVVRLRRRAG
jgi:dihydrofolate reductase